MPDSKKSQTEKILAGIGLAASISGIIVSVAWLKYIAGQSKTEGENKPTISASTYNTSSGQELVLIAQDLPLTNLTFYQYVNGDFVEESSATTDESGIAIIEATPTSEGTWEFYFTDENGLTSNTIAVQVT